MRLYFVKSPCRKCDHNHNSWVSESQRKAAFQQPPNEVLAVYTCKQNGCGDDVPLLARHLREATFDHHRTQAFAQNPRLRNLRLSPEAVLRPLLSERAAKVCALVVEGYTARRIASQLHVAPRTVTKDTKDAAEALARYNPDARRALPRQTVVAYYRIQAGSTAPHELFRKTA